MNTSIISHHLFVAALANENHTSDKPPVADRSRAAVGSNRTGLAAPSSKALAALAARPWVNWPFAAVVEERSAS